MTRPLHASAGDAPAPGRVLLRRGLVHTGDPERRHTSIAWEHGRIVGTGDETWAAAYDGADLVVDLAGRWAAPAFVDAHVHTVATGFLRTQLDLTACQSLADCLAAVAAAARDEAGPDGGDAVLLGTGWDESAWPEQRGPKADEIERAARGRLVFLNRIDGHSAVVSPRLADRIDRLRQQPGWHDSGLVELDAYAAVNQALGDLVGRGQRLAAARAAVGDMVRHGIAGFHENAAPHLGPAEEMALVRQAAAEHGLISTLYWGELASEAAFAILDRFGAVGLAGDLNADGAIGSCTAAMTSPYSATPDHVAGLPHDHRGHGFLEPDQIAEHVAACTRAGVQAGFHCIGDAALEAVADGFERAEAMVGGPAIRAARHRLEHVEMPSPRARRVLARLGVTASVQPVFDDLWGGPDGMYASRLGSRWRLMNPFRDLQRDGVRLAFGSDGPVTPMGPWQAIRAAVRHRTDGFGLDLPAAFAAHTRDGWSSAGMDDAQGLRRGQRAHVAIWDAELPPLATSSWLPGLDDHDEAAWLDGACEQLWVGGVGAGSPGLAG